MVEVLALIPARGGSKSIPRKNIRPFAGHPLIGYSIAAALKAKTVTRTIVSTDDEQIAEVARVYNAEVPFLRPAELAQDDTTDLPVFQHALGWLKEHEGYQPEIVVQLRPTSPIRPVNCVDDAVQLLLDNLEADSVRGVVSSGQNPFKMWQVDGYGRLQPLLSLPAILEPYNAPRQALPQTYWQTGHIDAIRVSTIQEQGSVSGKTILPLFIDPRYTVDIDTLRDWERAEWLVSQGNLDIVSPSTGKRPLPEKVELVIFDFDGVMTDDRVWVNQDGIEMVAASRSDGMGISLLLKAGIRAVVISTEQNPVVAARCNKLGLPVIQGVHDKATTLHRYLLEHEIQAENVVYVGNDINDLACFPLVGCAVVPMDAHPKVIKSADLILSHKGGQGAVRELCERLVK